MSGPGRKFSSGERVPIDYTFDVIPDRGGWTWFVHRGDSVVRSGWSTARPKAMAQAKRTISLLRAFGLRRPRYWGLAKTHVQHVAIAAAINIDRIVAWLDERPRAMTRLSRFAALAPANADHPGEAAA